MKKTIHLRTFLCLIVLTAFLLALVGSPVSVKAAPDVKLNVKTVTIIKGRTFSLKVYNTDEDQAISYFTSDETIAVVDKEGVITGVATGDVIITVKIFNKDGKEADLLKCEVTVGLPAISVKFTKSELEMAVGMRRIVKTLIQPGNSVEKVQFYSEDTSIATVSDSGRIIAKAEGITYIHAILSNGKFDTCTVTIVKLEPSIVPTATPEASLTTPAAIEAVPAITPASEAPVIGSISTLTLPTSNADSNIEN